METSSGVLVCLLVSRSPAATVALYCSFSFRESLLQERGDLLASQPTAQDSIRAWPSLSSSSRDGLEILTGQDGTFWKL